MVYKPTKYNPLNNTKLSGFLSGGIFFLKGWFF